MTKYKKQIKIKRCTTIGDVIETLNWCDANKYKILYISFNPILLGITKSYAVFYIVKK